MIDNNNKVQESIYSSLSIEKKNLKEKVKLEEKEPQNSTVIKSDLYKNLSIQKGEITADKNIKITENTKSENKRLNEINKTINTTKTIVTFTGHLAKLTGHDEFSTIITSSQAALTASEGIVKFNELKKDSLNNDIDSTNETKEVMSAVSSVATGVGTFLELANLPQAEIFKLTGKVSSLGVAQQDLNDNIKKNNVRGVVGTSVELTKGVWGVVISGVKTAKVGVEIGAKLGKVNPATVAKVTSSANKVSNFADKIAIPFAVAGSVLSFWDWQNTIEKGNENKEALAKYRKEHPILIDSKTFKKIETKEEKELEKKASASTVNSALMGLSFGASVVSTVALASTVVFPAYAPITGKLAFVGSIGSSVLGTLSDENKRESAVKLYHTGLKKYDEFEQKVDDIIFFAKKKK